MDSFEGEFGIPPQEMVEAMSQLTTQDLEKPPEKTVDHIIAKLNLDPQDELKAKKMYLGLLMQLKQIDVRAALPKSQDDMLSQLSAQRAILSSEKRNVMAGQIHNLNEKFWGKQSEQPVSEQINAAEKLTPQQAQEFLKKMVTAESEGLDEQLPQDVKVTASTDGVLKKLQERADSSDVEVDDDSVQTGKAFFAQQAIQGKHVQGKQEASAEQDNAQDDQPQQFKFADVNGAAILKKAHDSEFKQLTAKSTEGDEPKKIEKADVEALLKGDLANIPQGKLDAMKSAIKAMAIQPGIEMTPAQKNENIQQIMNQAQVLLKKGGGEVKVEMTPEGMGSIQLKLQVLDGKVQVHMNTETKEAKKLIESSMHDLKQSLAAHHLSMDLVKVDVVNSTTAASDAKNDLQNQMQNYFNQQQKEGTRQFWQSFNDSFGNRQARENIFDAENIKGAVTNQRLPGISATSSNGRAYAEGRGKSLNLVA
jgi:flagellar hook-length control protein FliK